MPDSFSSEVSNVLDQLLQRERAVDRDREARKQAWKEAVWAFREIAREAILPTLRDVEEPLRARGWSPLLADNSRFGLTVGLDVERDGSDPRTLCFRLDTDRKAIDALVLGPGDPIAQGTIALAEADLPWVRRTVLAFLDRLG
ncbi:MAG: hypothetical protein R2991_08355 [Thermoanaerobaculia bacterium]